MIRIQCRHKFRFHLVKKRSPESSQICSQITIRLVVKFVVEIYSNLYKKVHTYDEIGTLPIYSSSRRRNLNNIQATGCLRGMIAGRQLRHHWKQPQLGLFSSLVHLHVIASTDFAETADSNQIHTMANCRTETWYTRGEITSAVQLTSLPIVFEISYVFLHTNILRRRLKSG